MFLAYIDGSKKEPISRLEIFHRESPVFESSRKPAEDSELADSRALWELYFRKKEKDKAQRKLENKKETDPRKILGVE